ncbi:MAG: hypothetical protein DME02_06440 [Candidatus Rokuibacteriota bacterium]|nr:MAG: hypothetical protein DME02_06440 [Candidatus Rokubacteria bacterium]
MRGPNTRRSRLNACQRAGAKRARTAAASSVATSRSAYVARSRTWRICANAPSSRPATHVAS